MEFLVRTITQTCSDALSNQATFQLGNRSKDREDHSSRWRAGVDLLAETDKRNSKPVEGFQRAQQVRHQWEALTVFTTDGAVALDNNVSEREMKRVVLNRKNSLFVGNPRGGRTAAILASLTSSCRRHDMDPQLYFMQLLMNLPSWPVSNLDAWLPDRWKQAHAARCEALEISPLDA